MTKVISRRHLMAYVGLCALLGLCAPTRCPAADQDDTLSFGIVPQQSIGRLIKGWGPIIRHIADTTGLQLRFTTAPTIDEFESRCAAGDYDIAYMNPYHYVRYSVNPGYQVLAFQSAKRLTGIIVVRKDSHIKYLSQLQDTTLHVPSRNAFAASLLTRAMLNEHGIRYQTRFAGSHDAVYLNVARGKAQAGGGIIRTFNAQPRAIRDQLRVLKVTRGYTPHAFAVHPRVTESQREKIAQALLALPEALRLALRLKPLKRGVDADYDSIRALKIGDPAPTP